ncbi:hypothetical protein PVL29_003723 [Vitis rotundifolia]|uniref:Disease resistance R13L4/SHOC-2-like LRR domain-containing protein n=1 Tax=Vitis rotundifolia TaxID=103349 RepID=A0AA39E3G4_VITRO|nr:hypothetical protein PVL29_003723 [Vitis rotundifolia]
MPIRRKLEDAVPILLGRLLPDEGTKGPNTQDRPVPESNTQDHYKLLQQIREYFEERQDLFRELKRTEDELLDNFTALEEEIDNSKYGSDGSRGDPAHHPVTDSLSRKFKSIKDVVSKFERLKLEKSKESPKNNESEAPEREISEKWSALKVERRILKHSVLSRFQLSYDNIIDIGDKEHPISGCNIKLCLLCFSVFPPKSVIKKRPLIYWWLGEGLITKTEDGERIFGELIKKGLLIAKYKPYENEQDKNPIVDSCTMHSWIRLMLISVAKRAEFFDFDGDTGLPANHGTKSHRMCLVKQRYLDKQTPPNGDASRQDHTEQPQNSSSTDASTKQPQNSSRDAPTKHRLLTLFNVNEQYVNISTIREFSEENEIEVLQLGRWQDSAKHHIEVENEDFLKALGSKKHLKYLSLRGISRITEIPSSIRKLINLEILDLRACHNLEKLPSDISSLKKLTHLDISECYLLESMPKGLDKLSSLQVLKGFVVATSKKGPGRLGDVAGLKNLRKLSIYIPINAYIEDAELSKLKEVSALRILSITWGGGRGGGERVQAEIEPSGKPTTIDRKKSFTFKKDRHQVPRTDMVTMESLSFPLKLEKLDLWCIPCKTMPAWLNPDKLKSLTKLYIRGGKLDSLRFEGNNKWNVRILRLKYLDDLKIDKKQLRHEFPYLIHLEMSMEAAAASSSRSRS